VERRTLAVAEAVAELVEPVKQVLALSRRALVLIQVVGALMLVAIGGLAFAIWQQGKLIQHLERNGKEQTATARQLNGIVEQLTDVKADVEEIPRIEMKAADAADPTSKPVAIITAGKKASSKRPPKAGDSSRPAPIEIPLHLPDDSKKK